MTERLPDGCGYEGYEFGATYLDSQCFGGRLYDMDNCDGEGNLYEPGAYIPCPQCNHEQALAGWVEETEEEGYVAYEDGKPCSFPIPIEKLKYPNDYDALKAAWESGWKLAAKEKQAPFVTASAVSETGRRGGREA